MDRRKVGVVLEVDVQLDIERWHKVVGTKVAYETRWPCCVEALGGVEKSRCPLTP